MPERIKPITPSDPSRFPERRFPNQPDRKPEPPLVPKEEPVSPNTDPSKQPEEPGRRVDKEV